MIEIDNGYVATKTLPQSIGNAMDSFIIPPNDDNRCMFENLRTQISGIVNVELRKKAQDFIYNLELATCIAGIRFTLPRLLCDLRENEVYLEWFFPRFTAGFNISADGSEDGWFLISDEATGCLDEHGTDLFVIPYIVTFVTRYGHE